LTRFFTRTGVHFAENAMDDHEPSGLSRGGHHDPDQIGGVSRPSFFMILAMVSIVRGLIPRCLPAFVGGRR
jgi:hypothetical protein